MIGNRLFGREQAFPVRCEEMDVDNTFIQTSRTVQKFLHASLEEERFD